MYVAGSDPAGSNSAPDSFKKMPSRMYIALKKTEKREIAGDITTSRWVQIPPPAPNLHKIWLSGHTHSTAQG